MKRLLQYLIVIGMLLTSIVLPLAAETSVSPATPQTDDTIPELEQRPYASFFFPKDFLAWNFKTDPDAIHNVSKVPLQKRIKGNPVNKDQNPDAKVVSLPIANKNTSGTPSQGSQEKAIYNFTNWQYIDAMVGWAGSAGEGIIVPPSGDLIDIAHRNGVPIMGTVFFPPLEYGGKAAWIDEFLVQNDDGSFPMADKLIEMADIYGFDGWFINQETSTDNPKHGQGFLDFLAYYNNQKHDHMDLIWYDSMLETGEVSWQNELNEENQKFFQNGTQQTSDYIFLNFWFDQDGVARSRDKASALNRSPYDVLAGFDVQAKGINSQRKLSTVAGENGKAMTSVGLYAPDWTLRDGGKYDVDAYWKNESDFWVNGAGDPRDVQQDARSWQGMSRYFVEKSSLTSLPFHTSFNVGNGDNVYLDGTIAKAGPFNNRSVQDVMPTYRWILDQTNNKLKASIDYSQAYTGGSSIGLAGQMTQGSKTRMTLFASELSLGSPSQAILRHIGPATLNLVVDFEDDTSAVIPGKESLDGAWKQTTFDLSAYTGKIIKKIAIDLTATQTLDQGKMNIGYFGIDDGLKLSVTSVTNANIIGKTVTDNVQANLRLSWNHDMKNVRHFNIYRVENGVRYYEGSTSNTAYYIENQARPANGALSYEVEPVDQTYTKHPEQSARMDFNFEAIGLPTGDFHVTSSFIKVGDTVSFKANPSPATESVTWLIEGAKHVATEGFDATASFDKAGVYSVTMTLTNQAGAVDIRKENIVYVYDDSLTIKPQELTSLAKNFKASNTCGPNEGPAQAFDASDKTKWCDNQTDQPWLEASFDQPITLIDFKLHHAQAGGENKEWNTRDYEILTSLDGETWQSVVMRTGNSEGETSDAIAPTQAKHLKLILHKAESTGNVARIYAFKLFGLLGTDIEVVPNQNLLSSLRSLLYKMQVDVQLYTESSVARFLKAQEDAQQALNTNGANMDKNTLQELINRLTEAYENLELQTTKPIDPIDPVDPITPPSPSLTKTPQEPQAPLPNTGMHNATLVFGGAVALIGVSLYLLNLYFKRKNSIH